MQFIKTHIAPNLAFIVLGSIMLAIATWGVFQFYAFAKALGLDHLITAADINFTILLGLVVVFLHWLYHHQQSTLSQHPK